MTQFNQEVWPPLEIPVASADTNQPGPHLAPGAIYPPVQNLVSPTVNVPVEAQVLPGAVYPPAPNYVSPTVNAPNDPQVSPGAIYPPAGNYVSPTSNAPVPAKTVPNFQFPPPQGPQQKVSTSGNLIPAAETQQATADYIKVYNQSQLPPTPFVTLPGTNNTFFKIYNGPTW